MLEKCKSFKLPLSFAIYLLTASMLTGCVDEGIQAASYIMNAMLVINLLMLITSATLLITNPKKKELQQVCCFALGVIMILYVFAYFTAEIDIKDFHFISTYKGS